MPGQQNYYIYLLSNWNNQVLFIGMTSDLERRLYEHRQKLIPGFTQNTTSANSSIMNRRLM